MNWGLPSWLGFMKRLGLGAGCHRCHSHTENLSPCTSLMRWSVAVSDFFPSACLPVWEQSWNSVAFIVTFSCSRFSFHGHADSWGLSLCVPLICAVCFCFSCLRWVGQMRVWPYCASCVFLISHLRSCVFAFLCVSLCAFGLGQGRRQKLLCPLYDFVALSKWNLF